MMDVLLPITQAAIIGVFILMMLLRAPEKGDPGDPGEQSVAEELADIGNGVKRIAKALVRSDR